MTKRDGVLYSSFWIIFLFAFTIFVYNTSSISAPSERGANINSNGLTVKFERIYESPVRVEFLVKVKNYQPSFRQENLTIVVDSLNFPAEEIRGVKLYERKIEGRIVHDTKKECSIIKEVVNGTEIVTQQNCANIVIGDQVEYNHIWEEVKAQSSDSTSEKFIDKVGKITIPATELDGWSGDGTKEYKVRIETPLIEREEGGWGTKGVMRWDLGGVVFYDLSSSSWWDTNWGKRRQIFINQTSGIDLNSIVVSANENWDYTGIDTKSLVEQGFLNKSCADLRFLNGTSELFWEFAVHSDSKFGCDTNTTIIWINSSIIPAINIASLDNLFMYYNNSAANTAGLSFGNNSAKTWAGWQSVWHFEENGTLSTCDEVSELCADVNGNFSGYDTIFGYYLNFTTNGTDNVLAPSITRTYSNRSVVMFWWWRASFGTGFPGIETRMLNDPFDSTIRSYGSGVGAIECLFRNPANTAIQVGVPDGAFPLETWVHIACVANNTIGLLYINGTLVASQTDETGVYLDFADGVNIGEDGTHGHTNKYKIDELTIINNTIFSGESIKRYYEQGLTKLGPAIVTIHPSEDVHTNANASGLNAGNYIYLKFPLASIPSGAEITNAELILNETKKPSAGSSLKLTAYNCTGEWTESSTFSSVTSIPCTNTGNSTSVLSLGIKFWNLTSYIKWIYGSGEKNITLRLNSSDLKNSTIIVDGTFLKGGVTLSTSATPYAEFNSREVMAFTPVLNITYR